MSQYRIHYLSYLLRLWRVQGKRGWQWRASLESPGSGQRRAFPSLEHLIVFLRLQADRQGSDNDDESGEKNE